MKVFFYSVLGLFILSITALGLLFHPIDNSPENSIEVSGKVIKVYAGGIKDVCILLEADSSCYYINRGLENGLNLAQLRAALLNENVRINYAKHWPLSNIAGLSKHINQLEFKDSIIYTEW